MNPTPELIFRLALSLIFALIFSSCSDLGVDCETYDFSDCLTEAPTMWDLEVSISVNSENPLVLVTVFKGDFENGDTLYSQFCNQTDNYFELPVNRNYSVTALYKSGDRKILAVDGDEMRTDSQIVCEKKCWKVKGCKLDVRLKQ